MALKVNGNGVNGNGGAHLVADIDFIQTPEAPADTIATGTPCGVPVTNSPAIKNAPLPADGPGNEQWSNVFLAAALLGIPTWLSWKIGGGIKTTLFIAVFTTLPILIVIWTVMSKLSPRINDKVQLPGRPVEYYLNFKSELHRARWNGRHKIPMQTFFDLYLNGDVDLNADTLEVLEYRHDWALFNFTVATFRHLLLNFFVDVFFFHRAQDDEDQVRPTYDHGNDHYAWFLGPRMIYTTGLISDPTREETLEEMQDNKMAVVCEKIGLKEGDTLLDIGCGWGTLAKFASVNYGANVTGVTLARNQAAWGNDGLRKAGVPEEQSRILCSDYRDIPEQKFNKITQLEMAEHVGVRRLTTFFRQCYEMLEDDGSMYVQLSGLRRAWQYEDFIWGCYLNKYIFPGADASTPLSFYVGCLESAGFEVKSVDTVGVHYSGTLWRWYRNWIGNADKVKAKYGDRWFRIWELFLAYSTIASRQGSATCFQMVVVKNVNSTHRIDGVYSQYGLHGALAASKEAGKASLPK